MHYCHYIGGYCRAIVVRYIGSIACRATAEDGYAMRFQSDADWRICFIIALGVSLHVTSHFLYPIVVAVSVITTFLPLI